jgi:hypothetical protein
VGVAEETEPTVIQDIAFEDLIGAPLLAAVRASAQAARETADVVAHLGAQPPLEFSFSRPREQPRDASEPDPVVVDESVHVSVPLLGIVSVPSLQVDTLDVAFTLEMRSFDREGPGTEPEDPMAADPSTAPVYRAVGRPAAHREQTRGTDTVAKYSFELKASNHGTSEAMARLFDLFAQAVAPRPHPAPPPAVAARAGRGAEGQAHGIGHRPDDILHRLDFNENQILAFDLAGLDREELEFRLSARAERVWRQWLDEAAEALRVTDGVAGRTWSTMINKLEAARAAGRSPG